MTTIYEYMLIEMQAHGFTVNEATTIINKVREGPLARARENGKRADEAEAKLAKLRPPTCNCQSWPPEGPSPECPVHGAIVAFNEVSRELFVAENLIKYLNRKLAFLGDWDNTQGWEGTTADVHEGLMPQERVMATPDGIMMGACGHTQPGSGVCTRPAGHPRTRHVARNVNGDHLGEWDV